MLRVRKGELQKVQAQLVAGGFVIQSLTPVGGSGQYNLTAICAGR